jgi:hypothetical protein
MREAERYGDDAVFVQGVVHETAGCRAAHDVGSGVRRAEFGKALVNAQHVAIAEVQNETGGGVRSPGRAPPAVSRVPAHLPDPHVCLPTLKLKK